MDISKELAIKILKYLHIYETFYFPFSVMGTKSADETDFIEIEPDEWKMITKDETYQTFQLWENLQNIDELTIELMAKGFIEKIIADTDGG